MSEFKLHDQSTAPDEAKPLLQNSEKAFGMIPNLHAVMAESPQVLEAYQTLHRLFENSSLSADERNVIWLTISTANECHYCVPAHTAIAKSQGLDDAEIERLRDQSPLEDAKLEALRQFTLALVKKRGAVDAAEVDAFLEAGFDRRQLLEAILGVSQKVLSNYVNHVAETPVDKPFEKFAWR